MILLNPFGQNRFTDKSKKTILRTNRWSPRIRRKVKFVEKSKNSESKRQNRS